MKQVFVTIANSDPQMRVLLEAVNRAQFKRHSDLDMPANEMVAVTDCEGAGSDISPLPYGHFNQAIKCLNYVHAIRTMQWQSEPILLRDADTWLLRRYDFPASGGRIGVVKWRYKNLNAGALYIAPGGWEFYEAIVDKLKDSGHTHDERVLMDELRCCPDRCQLLPSAYNWDIRGPVPKDPLLMHVTRKAEPNSHSMTREFLDKYGVSALLGRGLNCFGNYAEGT